MDNPPPPAVPAEPDGQAHAYQPVQTLRNRLLAILIGLLALGILTAIAWRVNISTDLATMLPRNDPAFTREMDFFSRQRAAKLMAIEATVADSAALPAAERELLALDRELEPMGLKPLANGDPDSIFRAADIIESHLPELVTPEELAALEPQLATTALQERLEALKARVSRPEDSFLATLARQDVLALAAGTGNTLQKGLGGSRTDGPLMIKDERYALLVMAVPFDPGEMDKTNRLMETIDAAQARAAVAGVRLEGIGSYRHFRENMAAVKSDLGSSIGISVVLIMVLLYSLIPNVRALIAMHVPALMGMAGSVAAVVLSGQVLPLPILGFCAAILGVAVDAGQHVVVGVRSGHGGDLRKPLLLTFVTTTVAFGVLFTSSVPGLRCIATMVIGGLAASLVTALFLVPRLLPHLKPHDPWLRVSRPLLVLVQRWPRANWLLTALITAALVPGLAKTRMNEDLRKYDGSKPESWEVLKSFEERWSGEYRSSDFLVSTADDLDTVLERTSAARAGIGREPTPIEHLLPSRAEQARRMAAWNAFWSTHADPFAANLGIAAKAVGMRAEAFAPSLARYRPVDPVAFPPLVFDTWADTPIAKLIDTYVGRADGVWQVALPLGKLAKTEVATVHAALAQHPEVWVAQREHIGSHLVAVVQSDLASRGLAILVLIVLLVFAIERDWRKVTAQLLPSLLALVWTFGLLGWMDVALTPFAVLAAAFVAGIGIDSAVFLSEHPEAETLSPVLVASITTIAGVISLVNASHPMISAMGRVLALGMTFCLISCLLITPSLSLFFRRRHPGPASP